MREFNIKAFTRQGKEVAKVIVFDEQEVEVEIRRLLVRDDVDLASIKVEISQKT